MGTNDPSSSNILPFSAPIPLNMLLSNIQQTGAQHAPASIDRLFKNAGMKR